MAGDSEIRYTLRQLIQENFSLEEIRSVCFDLNIDYEELGESLRKSTRIIRLIQYIQVQERLDELLVTLRTERPHINWPDDIPLGSEPGQLVNVPPLPPHFVPREDLLEKIKNTILKGNGKEPFERQQVQNTGLHGMGGIGKTVLATAVANDVDVLNSFTDGIYWLEMNQKPNIISKQMQLAWLLGEKYLDIQNSEDGKAKLSQVLSMKNCLIILDDIWNLADLKYFEIARAEDNSHILFTTRDREIITGCDANLIEISSFSEQQSIDLLTSWVGKGEKSLPEESIRVSEKCGYLPLALALCGAQIRDGLLWDDIFLALQNADVMFLDHQYGSVMVSMENSIEVLSDMEQLLYQTLAPLPNNNVISEQTLITLWGHIGNLPDYKVRQQISKFARKALLKIEGESNKKRILLHDIQHLYLRQKASRFDRINRHWINSYENLIANGWDSLSNDNYFYENIHLHLIEAGEHRKLSELLCDSTFLLNRNKKILARYYRGRMDIEQYLLTCFDAINKTYQPPPKLNTMMNNLRVFAECLELDRIGGAIFDKRASCKHCGKRNIRHGYIDLGSVDFYDNYFSWCTSCYWAWHDEIFQMNGYEDPRLEFNYETNTYG